uniref:DAC domain-containing protein n=1 Tax=Paulinella chromatophora TaxID=39717 RepID=B1X5J0_PAUCH|nr:hypothetical protein PCC_0795 [Paulinella chromatophora]ACB43209.1 hypothetical protein PCC_0795 [Paulinella chromatophora]
MISWRLLNLRYLIEGLLAVAFLIVLLFRIREGRTQLLLRGYLLLLVFAWLIQTYSLYPLATKLVDSLVLLCSLSLAILWQGELRRLMELLGTCRIGALIGTQKTNDLSNSTVAQLTEAAGRLSQNRRGALFVVDLGNNLCPEDFLNPGITLDAQLSVDLLLNVFATDTPLHDGAVLVQNNRVRSAGVILPLSRQGLNRYGTRHLAALGITERFDQCICIVVSEETGNLSLANEGKLERPITSGRLKTLLSGLVLNNPSRKISSLSTRRMINDMLEPRA